VLCTMEELLPSIGTTVPSPAVLAVSLCQTESVIQNVGRLCIGASDIDSSFDATCMSPLNLCIGTGFVYRTYLTSISDDGKIWKWLLTFDEAKDARKALNMIVTADIGAEAVSEKHTVLGDSSVGFVVDVANESEPPVKNSSSQLTNSSNTELTHSIKVIGLTISIQTLSCIC